MVSTRRRLRPRRRTSPCWCSVSLCPEEVMLGAADALNAAAPPLWGFDGARFGAAATSTPDAEPNSFA